MMATSMPSGGQAKRQHRVGDGLTRPIDTMTKFRKKAAITISMTMQVVRTVPSKARSSTGTVSWPLAATRPSVAIRPSAAASVGVAMPA